VGIVIQLAALTISVVTLAFLIKYVRATEIIAKQSVQQVEATFRPAIVAVPGMSLDHPPKLKNIGKGPAIEVEWYLSTMANIHGTMPYLEPDRTDPYPLHQFPQIQPMKAFFQTTPTEPAIVCNYKSISGMK
jgi:hypothetical protein